MHEIIYNRWFWLAVFNTGALIYIGYRYARLKEKFKEWELKTRMDAIKRSKTVIRATSMENVVPLLEGFPYQIGDMKLFGQPIDYVVFDGMNEYRDSNKEKEITIILADLKTGKAVKTPVQKAIQNAIENGRVRFEEWRVDENNKLIIR